MGDPKIKEPVVPGGGTAGLLVAFSLRRHVPILEVTAAHSNKLRVIGSGEGTIAMFARVLHRSRGIDSPEFHGRVRPGYKLGIRYLRRARRLQLLFPSNAPRRAATANELNLNK